MKKQIYIIAMGLLPFFSEAQTDTNEVNKQKGEPLEGMDFTWINGGDRRSTPTLAGKAAGPR